ncbi:MAG: FtsX-like permease family protein, partial [bacterium]|nr:FtsX-like permease family protein [bacterium]
DPAQRQAADSQAVLPDYFETLGTPLIEGRTFTDDDNASGRRIAVIDQSLATKAFPNESAVGKRIRIFGFGEAESFEVIGVVTHQHFRSLSEPGRGQIYLTDGFAGFGVGRSWAVRTNGDPADLAPVVRAELEAHDSQLLLSEVQPMDALVARAQSETRFSLLLIGAFAVVAALLAAVGLYGVLSTVVRQRTAEIGVRMALGAAPAGIFRLVVTQGLLLSAAGVAGGLILALNLTHLMTSMLVGVTPTDPLTITAMAMLFLLIAAVASWLPARRAASIDPTEALRTE